jgi:hypothetical protein
MMRFLLYSYLFVVVIFLSFACSSDYTEAKEMGEKWCSCNEKMDKLYEEMNASDNQQRKDIISMQILSEQSNVLQCMGGEEKLRLLNDKFSGTRFQNYYDKTRLNTCPERVKLLSKKVN